MREGLDGHGFESVVGGNVLQGRGRGEGTFGLFLRARGGVSELVRFGCECSGGGRLR